MGDILYEAAIEYQKLKNITYKIILGRKNCAYNIMLHFPPEAFFHMAGLQHLEDLTFPSTNKERIYKEILNKKFKVNDIQRSIFYEQCYIEERLLNFRYLRKMIEANALYYLINVKKYIQYTKIRADYLCEFREIENILYLFIVKETINPRFENECKGCSFFTKHRYDYSIGASKTTTLLIERNDNGECVTVYKNPSYKEDIN